MLLRWVGSAAAPTGTPRLDFDTLARDLAQGVSRRQILRRLLGAAAASLTAPLVARLALEPAPVAAATATAPSGPCSSSKAAVCLNQAQTVLAQTLGACSPETVDQASLAFWLGVDQCLARSGADYGFDRDQCLGAGAGCPAGSQCSNDFCCPAGQAGCGAVCCAVGQSCVNGQCGSGTGGSTTNCAAGQTLCGSTCVNLQNDPNHCGSCGHACPSGQSCAGGQCATGCAVGLTACNGVCVNLQTDPGNCGFCRRVCTVSETCVNGNCVCPADRPDFCDGSCVNLQSNASHCGKCGQACGTGQRCTGSHCVCVDAALTLCSGICVNTQTDPNFCGGCGKACRVAQHCVNGQCVCDGTGHKCGASTCCLFREICRNGACTTCSSGHPCGDRCCPFSCEVDVNGVGKCQCTEGSVLCGTNTCCRKSTEICLPSGICGPIANTVCPTGQTACSGVCVNLQIDRNNCGACGTKCGVLRSCKAGKCLLGV
jgi:hypothetical protein